MTVSTDKAKETFTGDGSTTVFAVSFRIFKEGDIEVTVDGTVQTLNTDYEVKNISGSSFDVDFGIGTAPANGTDVVVRRDLDFLQETDYRESDPFPAASHEDALDLLTMIAQQLDEASTRSLRAHLTETSIEDLPKPADRRNKFLKFEDDSNANPTAVGVSDLGSGNVLDEDNFASNSPDDAPSQQSAAAYIAATSIAKALADAKGDLIVGTAADTFARLPVGANGKVLKADSGQSEGVVWGNSHNTLSAKSSNYTLQSGDLATVLVVPIDISSGSVTITELALGSMSGIVKYVVVADDGNDTSTNEAIVNNSGASEVWTGVREGDYLYAAYDSTNRRILDHRESHQFYGALTSDQSVSASTAAQLTGFTALKHYGSIFASDEVTLPWDAEVEISTHIKTDVSSAQIRSATAKIIDTNEDTDGSTAGARGRAALAAGGVVTWPKQILASGADVEMWAFNHYSGGSSNVSGDGSDETQFQVTLRRLY